jgi:SAM-dependent methyltransferase
MSENSSKDVHNAPKPAVNDPAVWSDLRRLRPVSRVFGLDRGTPVDRYYVERFLDRHRGDIRGRVMEVADAGYTRQFGDDRVTQSDVLHATAGNRRATIVGDLCTGAGIPPAAFDCIILTQVIQCIYDVRSAVATIFRSLAPGGVALLSMSGISQISRYDMDRWGEFWRFTDLSARRLFEESFDPSQVQVEASGNVLAATAFLQGLAREELTGAELEAHDADYQLLITVRACRPAEVAVRD